MGDYEGEVEKDLCQPRLNKWDDEEPKAPTKEEATPPTSSSQTKQVWKEKITSSPSLEQQSSESPSLRLDDVTEK
jgi:predicted restriction endonuclease